MLNGMAQVRDSIVIPVPDKDGGEVCICNMCVYMHRVFTLARCVQVPRAYVVLQDGVLAPPATALENTAGENHPSHLPPAKHLTESEVKELIHAHVNAQVSPYSRLRGGIVFVGQIPKSASGKLLRRVQIDIDRGRVPPLSG